MGWDPIGDIGKAVNDVAKYPMAQIGKAAGTISGSANPLGTIAGTGLDYASYGNEALPGYNPGMPMEEAAKPETPEERAKREYDQRIKNLEGDVKSFKWHSSGRRDLFRGQEEGDVKRQLAEQLGKTNLAANRRGLLGSGIQKAGEAEAYGQANKAYTGEVAKYNKYDEDLMKAYDDALIQAKQTKYKDDTQAAQDAYNQAVEKANKWEAARGSIFSGLGSILGGVLGGK